MKKKKIVVNECGPRDGWQNLREFIPTEQKIKIIDGIVDAGVKEVEMTSFVSPKAVSQMADSREIAEYCLEKYPDVRFWALVPNLRGAQLAWEAGVRNIVYVISLSESHNKANIRRTHEESFAELGKLIESYPTMNVCVGIATVFGCPYEGMLPVEQAISFAKKIWDMGIRNIGLADTIGIAAPNHVREVVTALQNELKDTTIQVHIHDTRNMGMVNTLAAIECGITNIQATLGGLGGCPFAPGASGNTSTEDLVFMLDSMGYDTGIDFEKLLAVAKFQKSIVNGNYSGHQINIDVKFPQRN